MLELPLSPGYMTSSCLCWLKIPKIWRRALAVMIPKQMKRNGGSEKRTTWWNKEVKKAIHAKKLCLELVNKQVI